MGLKCFFFCPNEYSQGFYCGNGQTSTLVKMFPTIEFESPKFVAFNKIKSLVISFSNNELLLNNKKLIIVS